MSSWPFRTSLLLLLATAISILSAAGSGGCQGLLSGGWKPIQHLNDPHVHAAASVAIGVYNYKSSKRLWLMGVKSGESRAVQGTTEYRLIIAASDGTTTADYRAVVWEKPDHSMGLISFTPVKKHLRR